jgi:hypothetical protein
MEARDELALIAEIGIALAGFLSILLVFASRDGRFSPADSVVVLSVVASGFGTVYAALVPLVLYHLGVQPPLLWRLCAAIALCSTLPISFYIARRERVVREKEATEAMPLASRIVALVIGLFNLAILSVLAFGGLDSIAPGIYLLSLVGGLVLGAWNFVSLALARLLSIAQSGQ